MIGLLQAVIQESLQVPSLDEILVSFSPNHLLFKNSPLSFRISATVLQTEQDGAFQCHSQVSQIVTKGSPSCQDLGKEGRLPAGAPFAALNAVVLKRKSGREQEIGLKSPPNQYRVQS